LKPRNCIERSCQNSLKIKSHTKVTKTDGWDFFKKLIKF
jgi:hypothetical protein